MPGYEFIRRRLGGGGRGVAMSERKYNFQDIEPKWQEKWRQWGNFRDDYADFY